MLYAAIFKQKESAATAELATRRAQWEPGEGVTIHAEYWLQTNDPALPAVTTIFETEDPSKLVELFADWDDAFNITIVPVITAEEGLQMIQQQMAEQQQG